MGNNVNPARKILLIATGGTIACRETGHGLTPVLDGEGLLRELPGLSEARTRSRARRRCCIISCRISTDRSS